MARVNIQDELNNLSLQVSPIDGMGSSDSLRYLQQTFGNLGEAFELEIQATTLTDMVNIANRLEDFQELLPQEIVMLGMWLVGGGNPSNISEAAYQEMGKSLKRIMEEMNTFKKESLTTEDLGVLQGLAQEGSRLTQVMTARQEHQDRYQKFERAIKSLSSEDHQFLRELLKSKLEIAYPTRA